MQCRAMPCTALPVLHVYLCKVQWHLQVHPVLDGVTIMQTKSNANTALLQPISDCI